MKKITCIICPLGCEIIVRKLENSRDSFLYEGAQCKAGEQYALKEMTAPERVVTSSVKINSSIMPLLSVRTSVPVPAAGISCILDETRKISLTVPVKRNDVIITKICGTDADLIATRSLAV